MTDTATLGTVEHIDPHSIEVEDNIRTVVTLDRAFVASIQQHGVLQPVLCRRDANGTIAVRAAVFKQLAFEGLSIPQIAKQTGAKRGTVEAGIKVAENEAANSVVVKHHAVTLDQAAAMIEFEDDPDALSRLVDTAESSPEHFAHELQRQRDNRARREAVAAERASLTELGYTVLDSPPHDEATTLRISRLATKEGEDITLDHLVGVGADRLAYVSIDWRGEVTTGIYVRNFKTYGFKKRPEYGPATTPMTDEQKAERKTLIANNKAWDSAETVRREWIATFLSRKTLPKDAAAVVTLGLTHNRHQVAAALSHGNQMAARFLGLEVPTAYGPNSVDAFAEQPGKTGHAALAIVLGGIEESINRNTWRNPTASAYRYLAQLAAWGYTLSEVEQIVIDAKAPRDHEQTAPEESQQDEGEASEPDDLDTTEA